MIDFIPEPPVAAAFVVASVILGLTPGPDMTFFLSKTVTQSRAAGFAALAGASSGLIVHSVLVAAGLSVILATSAIAFTVLKIAGAAYLAYLAIDAIRNGSSLSLDDGGRRRDRLGSVFLRGGLVNLLNPKVIIFFVTFLPQFVSVDDPHAAGTMFFLGTTFIVVNVVVCAPLIHFAGRIARMIKRSPQATRVIDWLFAGILGAFAVKLILTHSR